MPDDAARDRTLELEIATHRRDGALRLLAQGEPPTQIAERRPAPARGTARSELGALLLDARAVVAKTPLLPPAAAAFLEKPRIDPAADLQLLRDEALARLQDAIAAVDASETPPASATATREQLDDSAHAALRYAEAVTRQEDVLEALSRVDQRTAPLHASLGGDDRRRVDEFLLYRGVRGRFETVDSLVDRWARTVKGLGASSDTWSYDEYADRLRSRDALEATLAQVTPDEGGPLLTTVSALDRSFVQLTRAVRHSLRQHATWQPDSWWWCRTPRSLSDQFRKHLDLLVRPVDN